MNNKQLAITIEDSLPIQLAVIRISNLLVRNEEKAYQQLLQCAHRYRELYQGKTAGEVPGIHHARKFFRAIGVEPTRRRPSSEALLNRALKGKPFPAINTLVDVGNWCSLDFLLPICIYDAEKIVGNVTVRRGREGETYLALNNREINLANRYVLADEAGPFGSPITDSQRTAITLDTRHCLLIIFAPNNYSTETLLGQGNTFAERVIRFCSGELVELTII